MEQGQVTEEAWWVSFGASIRAARRERGLRQEDLAKLLGVARASVANIEVGRQHTSAYIATRLVAELDLLIPGWQVDAAHTILSKQLIQARRALMDVLGHLHSAQESTRDGLA